MSFLSNKIYKLLFTLFIIKLYARINIFKTIKKHGQDIYKLAKTLEDKIIKHRKVKLDIIFIKQCKKENIITTFENVNVSIKHGTYKLKKKIANIVMETEIQNKHLERQKLRKDIFKATVKLRSSISFILYSTVLYRINIAVESKVRAISFRHKKKMENLKNKQQNKQLKDDHPLIYIKHTVCNISSNVLSDEEQLALSFGLDQHVPVKSDKNLINTDFEHYKMPINGTKEDLPLCPIVSNIGTASYHLA